MLTLDLGVSSTLVQSIAGLLINLSLATATLSDSFQRAVKVARAAKSRIFNTAFFAP